MTFNEAMQILGNKLQEKYGHLGFCLNYICVFDYLFISS